MSEFFDSIFLYVLSFRGSFLISYTNIQNQKGKKIIVGYTIKNSYLRFLEYTKTSYVVGFSKKFFNLTSAHR